MKSCFRDAGQSMLARWAIRLGCSPNIKESALLGCPAGLPCWAALLGCPASQGSSIAGTTGTRSCSSIAKLSLSAQPACCPMPRLQGVFRRAASVGAAGADAPGAVRLRGCLGSGHGIQPRSNGVRFSAAPGLRFSAAPGQGCLGRYPGLRWRSPRSERCDSVGPLCLPNASPAGDTTSLMSWLACCLE